MQYKTLLVDIYKGIVTITLNRPDDHNSINRILIHELNSVLDSIEHNLDYKIVVLKGKDGYFSTGMDFKEVSETGFVEDIEQVKQNKKEYSDMLKRLSLFPKIIISRIEGQVIAGGLGFIAASDLAFASPDSKFSLTEAIWGLLPCMVAPYLIRKIGFHQAYKMTITTIPINAKQALEINLIDEMTENLDEVIRKYALKMIKISQKTIFTAKQYFWKLWIINNEIEQMAINQISELEFDQEVRENILNFVKYKKFPWEK